ncbi:hypothetical protein PINS_up024531 [Pythium insidiosum]|nr:hypothetical protein PINS_up024531 [Pythium insidiosum]
MVAHTSSDKSSGGAGQAGRALPWLHGLGRHGAAHLPPGRHGRQAPHDQQGEHLGHAGPLQGHLPRGARQAAYAALPLAVPGLGFAAGYKITQRIYKFGGQPIARDYLKKNHSETFNNLFGERNAKVMMQATAGSIIGIGEIGAAAARRASRSAPRPTRRPSPGRGVVDIFKQEGFALYRGAGWTAARNAPGSFALFGWQRLLHGVRLSSSRSHSDATFMQIAASSIAVLRPRSSPLDVIKTRVQARAFDSPESGMSVIKNLLKNEGPGALLQGIVGPKLVFSYTIAQYLIANFEKAFA